MKYVRRIICAMLLPALLGLLAVPGASGKYVYNKTYTFQVRRVVLMTNPLPNNPDDNTAISDFGIPVTETGYYAFVLFGGAGGMASDGSGVAPGRNIGGYEGFVYGYLELTAGRAMSVQIGRGGAHGKPGTTTTRASGFTYVWNGSAYNWDSGGSGSPDCGGGGGGSSMWHEDLGMFVFAGGGGGAAPGNFGGAGGGISSLNGSYPYFMPYASFTTPGSTVGGQYRGGNGYQGYQTTGGGGGQQSNAGTYLGGGGMINVGGDGAGGAGAGGHAFGGNAAGGGGGGGGYYGGGGGANGGGNYGSGGGGSSYILPLAFSTGGLLNENSNLIDYLYNKATPLRGDGAGAYAPDGAFAMIYLGPLDPSVPGNYDFDNYVYLI